MNFLKKPAFLSPSIPKGHLNLKGTRRLKNNKFQSDKSHEWTDSESIKKGTSDEWTDMESTEKGSSSACSSEEQVNSSDSLQFKVGGPLAISTPNSLFVQDEKEKLLEAAKYWSIYEGSFEKKCFKNSCGTQKEVLPAMIPKKRSKLLKRKQQYSSSLVGDKKTKCTVAIQSSNEEWTDLEEDTITGSLNESPVETVRFADSFDFNNSTSLAVSTPHSTVTDERAESPEICRKVWISFERPFYKKSCTPEKDPELSFDENQTNSSSDFSSVDEVSIADLEDFESFSCNEPSNSASTLYKKPSFHEQKNERYPKVARFRRSYKKISENECSKSFCATQKEKGLLFNENKTESNDFECFQVNKTSTSASPLCKKTSFLNDVLETEIHRSSFERNFEKESSKSSNGTLKHPRSSSDENRNVFETEKHRSSFGRNFEKESSNSSHGTQKDLRSSSDENRNVSETTKHRSSFKRNFEKESSKSSCVTQKDPTSSSDENRNVSETKKHQRSFKRNFEKESSKSSCVTQKDPTSSSDENRNVFVETEKHRNSFERNIEKESSKSSCETQKQPESSFNENGRNVSKKPKHQSSFERSFVKECSKNSRGFQKEMYTASVKKLKKRKLKYSGSFLVDNTLVRSKDSSKQVSKVVPTDRVLSDYPICPLGMDLVPGPVWASSSSFFECDVPIDAIYLYCNKS